jgi:hypothetical protein
MIQRILSNPRFNTIFSIVLGMALVFIIKPICNGSGCGILEKAPPVKEMTGPVYRYGEKCYKYTTNVVDCPATGVIESFSTIIRKKADSIPMYNGYDA